MAAAPDERRMPQDKVRVSFTLELSEAERLNDYLRGNITTLSEKVRFCVISGMDELKVRQRLIELDRQIEALERERAELDERHGI